MKITIHDRGMRLLDRLTPRLDEVALLRCTEHDRQVQSVTIHGRENGWFETRWDTCCDTLQVQAAAIVKERC